MFCATLIKDELVKFEFCVMENAPYHPNGSSPGLNLISFYCDGILTYCSVLTNLFMAKDYPEAYIKMDSSSMVIHASIALSPCS